MLFQSAECRQGNTITWENKMQWCYISSASPQQSWLVKGKARTVYQHAHYHVLHKKESSTKYRNIKFYQEKWRSNESSHLSPSFHSGKRDTYQLSLVVLQTNVKTSQEQQKRCWTFMYDELFKFSLGTCSLDNLLINCVSSDQSVDDYGTVLTDTVTAILCL